MASPWFTSVLSTELLHKLMQLNSTIQGQQTGGAAESICASKGS